MKIFLFILLLGLSFGNKIFEIKKYDEISISGENYIYIKLDDYKSGDNIYFEISHDNYTSHGNSSTHTIVIYYLEDNYNNKEAFSKPFEKYISNSSIVNGTCSNNHYVSIILKNNYKYLLIKPDMSYLKHKRTRNFFIVFYFFIVVIIIGLSITIILCLRNKMNRMKNYNIPIDTTQINF